MNIVEELIEQGRLLRNDKTWDGWMIHGRPVTNVEMYAMIQFSREERRKAEQFLKEEL
jgi:hypothetical protein